MKMQEPMNPKWVLVDDHFCTEFGVSVDECIDRYRNSMDEHVDLKTLTFYELNCPYVLEVFYTLKEKKQMKS